MKIKIAHLYPELLNLYGDRGNIEALAKRLEWRGIEVQVVEYDIEDSIDFSQIDILFLGGGSDREQLLVCKRMKKLKSEFEKYIESGGVTLAICGGYQLLGHYYKMQNERIAALGILDIATESGQGRLIGNIVIQSHLFYRPIAGFENHSGRTTINNHTPLGRVLYGYGNNDDSGCEGVIYKNTIGTYLHGPLLPKNPHLCDWILQKALNRHQKDYKLPPLDDKIELAANDYIVNRFTK